MIPLVRLRLKGQSREKLIIFRAFWLTFVRLAKAY
jgi:hypothetical protein